ncbi:MAG: hypothetical protein AAGD04_14610 [Pseudomonadota bacterium]
MSNDEVLMVLTASIGRRILAVMGMGILGAVCFGLGSESFSQVPATGVLLFALGGLGFWCAWKIWVATEGGIELTRDALRDADGQTIARIDDIVAVERGLFAFKPSNGFLLRLKSKESRSWKPGLWWRVSGRVGVGGVTSSGAARAMAEAIEALRAKAI